MIDRLSMLACFSLLASGTAAAGAIADVFSDGFRGITWTSGCAPDATLPGGRWVKSGPLRYYRLFDDKPIFDVPRVGNSHVDFYCALDSANLGWIRISFPGDTDTYHRLVRALTAEFGNFSLSSPDAAMEGAGPVVFDLLRWPVDEGFDLQVTRVNTDLVPGTYVTVTRVPLAPSLVPNLASNSPRPSLLPPDSALQRTWQP